MPLETSPLERAFVEDHRRLTRGFARLLEALQQEDDERAVQIADELDRQAGPHIEFEEHVLYPHVAETRGEQFVGRLYREHRTAFEAVRFLLERREHPQLTPEERAKLKEQVQTGLEHAISCGTLLSHLTVLDADRQAELLKQLEAYRRRGHRWLEVDQSAHLR